MSRGADKVTRRRCQISCVLSGSIDHGVGAGELVITFELNLSDHGVTPGLVSSLSSCVRSGSIDHGVGANDPTISTEWTARAIDRDGSMLPIHMLPNV